MQNWIKTLTDYKKRRDVIDSLLPLLASLEEQGGLTFDGDVDDPKDEQAHLTAQCAFQLIKEHPEYALLKLTKTWMIVRRRDLDKLASKDTVEKTAKDGVLVTRDNAKLVSEGR